MTQALKGCLEGLPGMAVNPLTQCVPQTNPLFRAPECADPNPTVTRPSDIPQTIHVWNSYIYVYKYNHTDIFIYIYVLHLPSFTAFNTTFFLILPEDP